MAIVVKKRVTQIVSLLMITIVFISLSGCGGQFKKGTYQETSWVGTIIVDGEETNSGVQKENQYSIIIDGSSITFNAEKYGSEYTFTGTIDNDKITWNDEGYYGTPWGFIQGDSTKPDETEIKKSNGNDIIITFTKTVDMSFFNYFGYSDSGISEYTYINSYYFSKES